MNDLRIKRVALVTGAGRHRVGNAVAWGLGEAGYRVAIHYHRSQDEAEQTVEEMAAAGIDAAAFQADVAVEEQVDRMFDAVAARFGRLDALVTAAAIWSPKSLEQTTAAEVRRNFDVNTLGTFLCARRAGLMMVEQNEGGAIVTDDPELFERMRLLRSHGMTTLTWDRHRGHAHSYDVVASGFNFRLDELRAALGLVQLGRLPEGNKARAAIVDFYRSGLAQVPDLVLPFADGGDREASHHLAVIVIPAGVARDELREALRGQGIQTSVHYPPIHRFSASTYRTYALIGPGIGSRSSPCLAPGPQPAVPSGERMPGAPVAARASPARASTAKATLPVIRSPRLD